MPKTIKDLHPAEWNPRKIGDQERMALMHSIKEFGDLSGIIVNKDGTLISGHQRIDTIKREFGDELEIKDGMLYLPNGEKMRVREVDWDDPTAKAAAIAANNQAAQGKFTLDVFDLVSEVEDVRPDLADRLALRYVEVDDKGKGEDEEEEDGGEAPADTVMRMELQPYEHYDYVVVLARNTSDWFLLCEALGLEKVDSSPIAGKKKIGLGRGVDASQLLKLLRPAAKKATKPKKEAEAKE